MNDSGILVFRIPGGMGLPRAIFFLIPGGKGLLPVIPWLDAKTRASPMLIPAEIVAESPRSTSKVVLSFVLPFPDFPLPSGGAACSAEMERVKLEIRVTVKTVSLFIFIVLTSCRQRYFRIDSSDYTK